MIYLKRFNETVQEESVIDVLNNGMIKVKRNELPFFFDMMRNNNVSFRTFGFDDAPSELYFTIINNKLYHNTSDNLGGRSFKVTDFKQVVSTDITHSELESDIINDYMTEITDSYYFEFSTSLHSSSSYYIYKLNIPNECISEFTNQWLQANKRIKQHFSDEIVYSNMIIDKQFKTNYTITIEVKL